MLDERFLPDARLAKLNEAVHWKRFLDDLWFVWLGTDSQFQEFKHLFNRLGAKITSQ